MKDREIEVKILEIDIKKTISKLKKAGAKKISEHIYTRLIIDFPDNSLDKKHGWVRLRTDGKKTTLTYKQKLNNDIDGMQEIETEVCDFEKTRNFLKALGLEEKRVQENRRIAYSLNGSEVTIELWPKIPPYMEVESGSKRILLDTLRKLEIDIKDTTTETPNEIYTKYGFDLHKLPILKLEKSKKEMKI